MAERRVTIAIAEGLHARPAALFAQLAGRQPTSVSVGTDGRDPVPADSLLSVMALGAKQGDDVVLTADGPDADAALDALADYLSTAQ